MPVVPFTADAPPPRSHDLARPTGGTTWSRRHALDQARQLEALAAAARAVSSRLSTGPWGRTRRRLRHQLRRLGHTLDQAERHALSGDVLVQHAASGMSALLDALRGAMRDDVTKSDLKALRRLCKAARHRLEGAMPLRPEPS